MPAADKELLKVRDILEQHFHDMQDLEFTVEDNTSSISEGSDSFPR
jgi:pyruvate, orthophosphate dikinase